MASLTGIVVPDRLSRHQGGNEIPCHIVFLTEPYPNLKCSNRLYVVYVYVMPTDNGIPGSRICEIVPGDHEAFTKVSWVHYQNAGIMPGKEAYKLAEKRPHNCKNPMGQAKLNEILNAFTTCKKVPEEVEEFYKTTLDAT